ncbi:MAG: hypothetical protein OQK73_06750 [Gammaproteobacteria bacterium]|nr:hypothetical protein [Gammaproteobacteria bacterium]
MKHILTFIIFISILLQGCAGVNTFPTVARTGDTVSVMIGGSEKARKETTLVTLTDVNGTEWDLQALGLVRSVFNLRADGRAEGMHYSSYLDSYYPWYYGHEPVQTVLVVDIPANVPAGSAYFTIDTVAGGDSSGIASPYNINLDIVPGLGESDNFLRKSVSSGYLPVDFDRLEPAPHAKISFGITDGLIIGAASLVVDFDETVVSPADINIYIPESTVRGSISNVGSFGETQRMVYWHQDGQQLYIDIIAPQGIKQMYLMAYIMHPRGIVGNPAFSLSSYTIYDFDGNELLLTPSLEYFP